MPEPTMLFTCAGLAGVAISVTGNETAQRFGRNRVVLGAVTAAAILSLGTGWTTGISAVFAAVCVVVWNMAIYFDSSALTAGTLQAADQHLRGATMGLHSMAGYAGGSLGPLGVGLVLDLCGGDNLTGWGLAFGHLALVTLIGLFVLRNLGRIGN
jgi:MFS family permease